MIWGAYFAMGHCAEAKARGYGFTWLHADLIDTPEHIAELAASGLKIVLTIFWTEKLLHDSKAFCEWLASIRDRLRALGLLGRIIAVQFDDEFYEKVATDRDWFVQSQRDWGHWPTYAYYDPCPHRMTGVARAYADRKQDFIRVWGGLPLYGVGVAINAAVTPPQFIGQDWWGCNFYLTPDQPPAKVHELYAKVTATGIRVMPILGIYSDSGLPLQPLASMGAAYLPVLERYRHQIPFAGIFCYAWPDGTGKGVRQLPVDYQHGEAYLLQHYGNTRGATMANPFKV